VTSIAEADKNTEDEGGEDSALVDSPAFVKAKLSEDFTGEGAGSEVEVLADDYTSKGDEDMIEVKMGDDLIFVEKKFVKITTDEIEPAITDKVQEIDEDDDDDDDYEFDLDLDDLKDDDDDDTFSFDMEEEPSEEPEEPSAVEPEEIETIVAEPQQLNTGSKDTEMIILQAKLKKSLAELEDLRNDMHNTFTSSDTLSNTITSLKGMLDAMKKDQMNILSRGE
jgi:hypothetical protein